MPLVQTRGAASAQGFGEFAQVTDVNYIENVFSTWLYTGTGSGFTITNGLNLSGKGGLVWNKSRTGADSGNFLDDTVRGADKTLVTNSDGAQASGISTVTAFNSTGFNIGTFGGVNTNAVNYVSWAFREQAKFFDIVTWTGTGANRTIAHSLGAVPGSIIVKRRDTTADWAVYHRSLANTQYLVLNTTAAAATGATWWNSTTPTSSVFSVGTDASVNASGGTYVAYIFAHDAGGFGLLGTDNVVSCGSFTTDGSGNATVSLGYEPQWLLIKTTSSVANWLLYDNMRGIATGGDSALLRPNLAEGDVTQTGKSFNATGFAYNGGASTTHIYIAIRRGPMKVPTDATKVFLPSISATSGVTFTTGFTVDMFFSTIRAGWGRQAAFVDRLRSAIATLESSNTDAESTAISSSNLALSNAYYNDGITGPLVSEAFSRAPSFFDIVCYTGTGSNTTQTHNLGVVPELIIVKRRNSTGAWDSYCSALSNTEYVVLNTTAAKATGATRWNSTTPTSSVFSVGTSTTTNASAGTYVAYLFATCAGVSKVGSYTGNGSTQTINCGLTAGARFVLIKKTSAVGDWYVYDTARGMTVLTDPYFLLNDTAAETATLGSVTTVATGFAVNSAILAAINTSAATFIFLAIG